jgi:hypothetical protein
LMFKRQNVEIRVGLRAVRNKIGNDEEIVSSHRHTLCSTVRQSAATSPLI